MEKEGSEVNLQRERKRRCVCGKPKKKKVPSKGSKSRIVIKGEVYGNKTIQKRGMRQESNQRAGI